MTEKPIVRVSDLGFSRNAGKASHGVLRGLGCTIECEEFVSLVGRSGSGKSTLVSLIAGLLTPEEGKVEFPNGRPKIGVQFQTDAVFPWRRVWSNLGYAMEIAGKDARERKRHAAELSLMVGLNPEIHLEGSRAKPEGVSWRLDDFHI